LRVPEALVGKNVKCPKCETTFIAELDAPAAPEGVVREPTPSATASSRRREEEFQDEPPPPLDDDEDYPRPRRRRRRRLDYGQAESDVAGPAIAMMVVAGLDIAYHVVALLMNLLGVGLAAASTPKGAAGPQGVDLIVNLGSGIIGAIIGLSFALLILVGAIKMKNLSSYGLAMTACIISMLPCHSCCCLGLPFGIWGLVILNKPEVKDAFNG
jgi:hypothetical protein